MPGIKLHGVQKCSIYDFLSSKKLGTVLSENSACAITHVGEPTLGFVLQNGAKP